MAVGPVTGDTPDTVAVCLAPGHIVTPTAYLHLRRHPACVGQVLTAVPLRGWRRPAGATPLASAGAFSAHN